MLPCIADYALRTVVCLAKRGGRPTSARDLAVSTGIPRSFQPKVLQALRRARIVRSSRGLNGGCVLIREPESLSLQEVIHAVDPNIGVERAWEGADPLPILQRRLRDGVGLMESLFASITIAELLTEENAESERARGDES